MSVDAATVRRIAHLARIAVLDARAHERLVQRAEHLGGGPVAAFQLRGTRLIGADQPLARPLADPVWLGYVLLAGSGLTPMFPLWQIPTPALARDMIGGGLRAHIACVDTRVLDQRFVGRSFDDSLLDDLPAHIDPCGENGEFHTCVHAGPMFHELLDVVHGRLESRDPFVWVDMTVKPLADVATAGADRPPSPRLRRTSQVGPR